MYYDIEALRELALREIQGVKSNSDDRREKSEEEVVSDIREGNVVIVWPLVYAINIESLIPRVLRLLIIYQVDAWKRQDTQ